MAYRHIPRLLNASGTREDATSLRELNNNLRELFLCCANQVQFGKVSGDGTNARATVRFAKPFDAPPAVTLTVQAASAAQALQAPALVSVTRTGFTLRWGGESGAVCHYVAVAPREG